MSLVALEGVTVRRGTRAVLDDVTCGVVDGARIGVVGRNGGGKTTLLTTLADVNPPDAGRVLRGSATGVALLRQDDDLDPGRTVRDVVVGDAPTHAWAADPRVREVLTGLLGGVEAPRYAAGLATTVATMSGGERRRVALAAALVTDPDVLLLDEPTNHLDVEAIGWLAEHVAGRRGASVVVTHDRWFLDAACSETWEVADGRVHRYDGGYAAFVLARAERARSAAVAEERRANLLRKELAWLRRGAPARTSKPRFRIDAAEALIADEPPPRDRLSLQRLATARLGRQVYDLEDVTLAPAPAAAPVVVDQTWRLGPGDRIGLLGPNGAGKTTVLRLLAAGRAAATDDAAATAAAASDAAAAAGTGGVDVRGGRVRVGVTVVPALLTQHVAVVDPDDRVLACLERARAEVDVGRGRTLTARALLEGFGFAGDRLTARLGDLSGGEVRRFALLRLLVEGPNVLLLDEPTNDLDVETLTVLEDLLDSWPGTLVVVSHDRYFLERTTDEAYALLGDGAIRHLPGGVDEYLRRRRDDARAPVRAADRAPDGPPEPEPPPGTIRGAGTARVSGAAAREARKELARIERRLDRIAAAETDLHERLAAAATDHVRVQALDAELRALADERVALETRWLETAESLG